MNSGGIKRNEKFAFVAMSAHVEDTVSEIVFGAGIRATTKLPLTLDEEWKTWIGSIRTNYLEEDCTLFLYASLISKTAGILDRENVQLAGRVSRQLEALTLTGNIIMAKAPILATGAHDSYGASLRQISDIVVPFVPGGVNYHYIDERMLREAYAYECAPRIRRIITLRSHAAHLLHFHVRAS